jgi:hypothetical protein
MGGKMITPSFALTATERVLPKLALDFTTASLDSRITFTRTGATATVVNSSGLIQSVAADTPRFDYNPITLACNGLLIEESRTNTFQYTIAFTTGYWSFGGVTGVVGQTSPDGTGNGTKLEEDATTGNHQINRATITLSATTAYTISIFLKAAERTKFAVVTTSDGIATQRSTVDLTAQTNSNGTITNFGNGWFRVTQTFTTVTGTNTQVRFRLVDASGSESYAGTLGDGLYIWGAQLEAGAFATSYIPTTTAALTRNADVATMTGTNFSDWYNATEGTFSATLQSLSNSAASGGRAFCVNDNTAASSYILVWVTSASQMRSRLFTGGATQYQFSFTNDPSAENTITTAYKVNNFAGANNGGTVSTDASGTLASPAPTQLVLTGDGTGTTEQYKGHLKQLLYWPQRLTNAEVQAFSKG